MRERLRLSFRSSDALFEKDGAKQRADPPQPGAGRLLRGPQTPGELRSRTNRLCSFDDVTQVDAALAALIEQGPYVVKLPREPGKRESRYAHLFSGEVDLQALAEASPASSYASPAADRLSALEEEVETPKSQLQALEARLAQLEG